MLLFKMIHSKLVWLTATEGAKTSTWQSHVQLKMPSSHSSNKFLFRSYSVWLTGAHTPTQTGFHIVLLTAYLPRSFYWECLNLTSLNWHGLVSPSFTYIRMLWRGSTYQHSRYINYHVNTSGCRDTHWMFNIHEEVLEGPWEHTKHIWTQETSYVTIGSQKPIG